MDVDAGSEKEKKKKKGENRMDEKKKKKRSFRLKKKPTFSARIRDFNSTVHNAESNPSHRSRKQ